MIMSLAISKQYSKDYSVDNSNDLIVILDDGDDESDLEIEEISNIIEKQNERFFKEFLYKLPLDTEVIVVKVNSPIRVGTTALNYPNLLETQIIIVNNALISTTECIPKRYLYINKPDPSICLPIRTRIYHHSSSLLGFILEQPCLNKNQNRYLILYDNHTAAYHSQIDFHLCLCQEFCKHLIHIDYIDLRLYYQQIFDNLNRFSPPNRSIGQIIRVKKFGSQYHNARIIDKDHSIIKICFFERKSQAQMWIYSNSSIIQSYQDIQIVSTDLTRLRKRKTHVNEVLGQKKLRDRSNTKLVPLTKPQPQQHLSSPDDTFSSSRANMLNAFYTDVLLPKFRLLNNLPYHMHKCSSQCVEIFEEHLRFDRISINPFLLPFECQWSIVDGRPRGYRTPCHRTLYSLDEIEKYLYRTDSKLSIKFFIDDLLTRFTPSIDHFEKKFILNNDLSNGLETILVSVYNDLTLDQPDQFTYVTEIRPYDRDITRALTDRSLTTCCNCTDNCSDRMKCACFRKTLNQALINHDPFVIEKQKSRHSLSHIIKTTGYQKKRLLHPVSSGIYECNSQCSCHRQHCSNRLIQQGVFVQLQLFKDKNKGWGLRTLHDLPRGTFICQYLGELITSDQGHERAQTIDDKYQTSLDLIKQIHYENELIDDEEEPFVIDGSLFSNLGKYFNHSCDPNMYIQNVFIESHDLHFPNLALFTLNRVKAGEELTWHYNCELLPDREVKCYCGAKNCRGRLF